MIQLGRVSGKGKSRREGEGGPGSVDKEPGPGGLVGAGRVAQEPLPQGDMRKRRLQATEPETAWVSGGAEACGGSGSSPRGVRACVWWRRDI